MNYTFEIKREYPDEGYTYTTVDVYVDGISKPIGQCHFTVFSDMGMCLEHYKLRPEQGSLLKKRAVAQYGAKSLYVAPQHIGTIGEIEAPKYPSRARDSEFFDFGTIVVLDEVYFRADSASRFSHLPRPERGPEYWEFVKQSLLFMIKHADASTLGWIMPFRDYNNFPMLGWLDSEGFERLLVTDEKLQHGKYIKSKQQEDVFVILR